MTAHVLEQLPELALGGLEADERARVEEHLAHCASCAREARAWTEVAGSLALSLPARARSTWVRARVLAAAEGRGRLARHGDALARFFEIPLDKANALLDAVDASDAWEPNPAGIGLIHLAPGGRWAAMGADAGLVRFPAGIEWPLHRHIGEERHLFLEGAIRIDQTGQVLRAGDELVSAAGTEHSFHVLPESDCVAAVILEAGIELPPGTRVTFD